MAGLIYARRSCRPRSTRAQAADLDGDGWLDLIFGNQMESESQFSSILIYWGEAEAFSLRRHARLPTWGGYGICVADYNRDGCLDIAVPSYKGFAPAPPSRACSGSPRGFGDTNYTALQTDSGAKCMAADFNRDGWTDLLILCHRHDANSHAPAHPADDATNSFLYWSGSEGFQRKPYLIPTVGTHYNNSVDCGNTYDRKLRSGHTSTAFEFGNRPPRTIHWQAKAPFHSFVRFQVRTNPAARRAGCRSLAWAERTGRVHAPRGRRSASWAPTIAGCSTGSNWALTRALPTRRSPRWSFGRAERRACPVVHFDFPFRGDRHAQCVQRVCDVSGAAGAH
jgi:hypothetical protein